MTSHSIGDGASQLRRSASWSDGYTVDSHYSAPMVLDLSPARLSAMAVLEGQPPLPTDRTITWVDLGCGHGLNAAMVAAANPGVEVWGFDYNPAHVERAQGLARASRLDNCRFVEAGFDELADDPSLGPTEVDVFVTNGVYSWIAPSQQAALISTVGQRLVPGGMAYVMYESPTGWSSMIPVAEALHLHAAFDHRRGERAFHDAAAAVVRLAESGAASFPLGPTEQAQVETWATMDGQLGAHEYLGSHFGPLMFDQVATAMAAVKCDLVGSLDPVEQLARFWVRPELVDLVRSTDDVVLREMLRDVVNQHALRRDVFRRGLASPTAGQVSRWLGELRVTSLGQSLHEEPVRAASGRIGLDAGVYGPLLDALADRDLGIDDIMATIDGWGVEDAVTAIAMLIAAGYAAPTVASGVTEGTVAASRRLNGVLIDENRMGANHSALVAPAIGAAVGVDSIEMAAIGAIWAGMPTEVDALTDQVLGELAASGRAVREDGELVTDPDLAREIVTRRVSDAVEKHDGVFVTLGISGD